MNEYLDKLESELRAASSRRVLVEMARVPRPPASAFAIGAAVIVAAVVLVFGLRIGSPGTTRAPADVGSPRSVMSREYRAAQALLAGIPQSGRVLGRRNAPVSVTFFGDLESPLSRDFVLGREGSGFPRLVRSNVRLGAVKIIFRSFCTSTCNSVGMRTFDLQQVAAYAAGKQDLFWDYAELFYREQGKQGSRYVTTKYLRRLASQIPALNLARWQDTRTKVGCFAARPDRNALCAIAPTLLAEVRTDARTARTNHVLGTPTIDVTGPKGTTRLQSGLPSYTTLEHAIKRVR